MNQYAHNPINPEHLQDVSAEELLHHFTMMNKIRLTEETIADAVARKEITCPCHLYIGQEVIATAVCASLKKDDYVFSNHRSHGHYLAKGGDLKAMMAEIFCRRTGCSRGKGGSMHLTAPEVGFPGSSAIVAGSLPLAVGVALSFKLKQEDRVAVSFFGDGATNEGAFYESLNLASLKKLPVIFVCENNLYATHMPLESIQSETDLYKKSFAFNMPSCQIDGNNFGEVLSTAREAVERARRGEGPTLIECITYRWRGHVGPNWDIDKGLRPQEEVDSWVDKCGIKRLEEYLINCGILNARLKTEIMARIEKEVEEAYDFARESPFPSKEELYQHVYK